MNLELTHNDKDAIFPADELIYLQMILKAYLHGFCWYCSAIVNQTTFFITSMLEKSTLRSRLILLFNFAVFGETEHSV